MRRSALSLLLALTAACGGRQDDALTTVPETTDDVVEEAPIELAGPPTVAETATPVQVVCEEGAAERCNALDDDCDGSIDEGCGYSTGPVQVTVAWNSDADLDVYVIDPGEETVSFQRREGATGAVMDQAARGACAEDDGSPAARVENVFWSRRPPPGEYRVELHYLFECDTDAGPTTATVSVAVGGQTVGAYNLTLTPTGRETVVRFELR